jgi:K+-transporting ATPase ATPase C chain
MKSLASDMFRSVGALLVLLLLTCGLYPVLVWGVNKLLFPFQAEGSLLLGPSGELVGSRRIGQPFQGKNYFHPRPSMAGDGYDPMASGGSNWTISSKKFLSAVSERAEAYRKENGLPAAALVPMDAVTASGSGLDPHISLQNAAYQVPRVAQARGLPVEKVEELVRKHTEKPILFFLGDPVVNVVTLNLELDQMQGKAAAVADRR